MQSMTYRAVKISMKSPYLSRRRKQAESYTLRWLYWRIFPSMRFLHCFGSTRRRRIDAIPNLLKMDHKLIISSRLVVFGRYSHWIWWILRSAPANSFQASFLLTRLSREMRYSLWTSVHVPDFIFMMPPPALSRDVSSLHSRSTGELRYRRQGRTEHFPSCPSLVGSSRCHCRATVPVALRSQLATSRSWLHERHSQ